MWTVVDHGLALLALNSKPGRHREQRGQFIKASGSTITTGHFTLVRKTGALTLVGEWGTTLLGKTQKRTLEETAAPSDRAAEFVLDYIGAIQYGPAKKRTRPYSKS